MEPGKSDTALCLGCESPSTLTGALRLNPPFPIGVRRRDQHSDFSFAAGYSPSNVTCTSFISAISVMTIARVPLRSNTIPFARTYLPTKGISFCR
jgi:hypothetical protein